MAVVGALLFAKYLAAQTPNSATPPGWGGYVLPAEVPYQPTLDQTAASGAECPPIYTEVLPPNDDAAWQAYATPNTGGPPIVLPDGSISMEPMPDGAPIAFPDGAMYPDTPEPSLRQSLIPPDARDGFFQKAKFTATWLPQFDENDLGWTDLKGEVVTALPFFTRENPIIITPSYQLHLLEGPQNRDLPPRLHDAAIDFHFFRIYDNHWIFDFAVAPGLYADDHSFDSNEAWRVNGRALAVYAPTVDLKWVLGVTYVDGGWAKVVPVVGVTYQPTDDVNYELVFPQPKISWRLPNSPIPGRDERWLYVGMDFANAAWAIEQSDGTPDVLAYRDYRLFVGLERKICGGLSRRVEIGYAFNRDIKLASNGPDDIGMGSTLMLRAGIAY
jgi:hypothetical protein